MNNFFESYDFDGEHYDVHYYITDKGYCYREYKVNNVYHGKKRISEVEYINSYNSHMNY